MKKHMKGFTLVELLAVIVILAIVLIIAVPGVLSIINSTKQKGYESQLKMIKEAARNYVTADSSKISWVDQSDGSKQVIVTLTELQENGYLDKKIIDPRDKSVITCAEVTVKRDAKNKISYGMDTTTCKPTEPKCFTFVKDTGTITDYDDTCSKKVKIPSEIDGTPVVTIGYRAFSGKQLTSVVIPNSVTHIGTSAFQSNQLTSVAIPNSVTNIELSAFGSNKLTSVVIPNSVINIGDYVFYNNQLTSVVIPTSVTHIGSAAFNANQLDDNAAFIYKRNWDGTEDKSTLVSYGGSKRSNVIIPNSVTTIGEAAFFDNQLTSVTIPNSVTTIGVHAFYENQLESIVLPNSVITIGKKAFCGNELTSISIGNGVTTIGEEAFADNPFTSVTIPSSVKTIKSRAFFYTNLSTIIIKGKTSLSEFVSLEYEWYPRTPTITFEP